MQLMSTDRKSIHAVLQEIPKVQILFEMTLLNINHYHQTSVINKWSYFATYLLKMVKGDSVEMFSAYDTKLRRQDVSWTSLSDLNGPLGSITTTGLDWFCKEKIIENLWVVIRIASSLFYLQRGLHVQVSIITPKKKNIGFLW